MDTIVLVEELYRLLMERGWHVTTAESCTGGKLSAAIVDFPGASDILCQALVTYSNEAKERLLGVGSSTLEMFGAVSEQTAEEMAVGAARSAGCELALSTTGVAGPGGATPGKPVGLVYIGCYCDGRIAVKRFVFEGSRNQVRDQAVKEALTLAVECMNGCNCSGHLEGEPAAPFFGKDLRMDS